MDIDFGKGLETYWGRGLSSRLLDSAQASCSRSAPDASRMQDGAAAGWSCNVQQALADKGAEEGRMKRTVSSSKRKTASQLSRSGTVISSTGN